MPILFAYILLVFAAGFMSPQFLRIPLFGFGQARYFVWNYALLSFVLILIILTTYHKWRRPIDGFVIQLQEKVFEREIFLMGIALLGSIIFFLFRSHFLNADGEDFAQKFEVDIHLKGAHITHDEIFELYIHSRFWFYTNRWFGWDVPFSYQVLSCIAGGVFIYILLHFARNITKTKTFGLFLIVISGGYMQLFFGDVENYSLTAVLILAYLFASYKYIHNKCSLLVPSSLLALALMFHLLSGFLMPSLLYLYFLALKEKKYKDISLSFLISLLIVAVTLIYFHYHNLPIQNLLSNSHASGRGGHYAEYLVKPSLHYYGGILSLILLLAPILLFFPLGMLKKTTFDPINIFLAIASLSMIGYMLIWKAGLGIYQDWNLFANVAIPISVFVAKNAIDTKNLKGRNSLLASILLLFFVQSFSWILYNHHIEL